MDITPEHMRASYDTYIKHGNSSSATILSVMDRLRQKDMDEMAPGGKVKDFVVGCAFGPGITIEMCMLKRNLNHVRRVLVDRAGGDMTPPDSEGNRSEGEPEIEAAELENEISSVKDSQVEMGKKLNTIHPEIPEQNDSLSEALNGVELD